MTKTQISMWREIAARADRDSLGYGGRAWISKDPKSVIVDDRKQLLELMEYEQSMLSRSIGTDEFLDPPCGGGPSLCTQVQRMKAALDSLRNQSESIAAVALGMNNWEFCPICRGNLDTGWECDNCGADFHPLSTCLNESLSGGNPGEPTACTTAEERGIEGATGAGQLPADNEERTRDSAERRSPVGTECTPSPDESTRYQNTIDAARSADNSGGQRG